MSDSFYDMIVVLFFTAVPVTLILIQLFLAGRKKLIWGFIVPILWTSLGAWMIIRNHNEGSLFSFELVGFFLLGDGLLLGLLALVRVLKIKRQQRKRGN